MRTRIKMCGTTNHEDAQAAVRGGVDALGFIFVAKSPRHVSVEKAKSIIAELPPLVDTVGVFLDHDQNEMVDIVRRAGLTAVQLHGNEDPEYCRQVSRLITPCMVIKAFRIGDRTQAEEFSGYTDIVRGFLLDTYVKHQEGGTGRTFDWHMVGRLHLHRPVILAGGLRPGNIQEAVRIVKPFGVDVNSGVEISPGRKDHEKLFEVIRRVRLNDEELQ